MYQVTEFVRREPDIQFAIDQLEKYGSKFLIEEDLRGWVAVFRPRKDIALRRTL